MRAVLQRAQTSSVVVSGKVVGAIEHGFVVLLGVGHADTEEAVVRLVDKIIHMRVFEDAHGKMNQSIVDTGGSILLVSQFTLFANCKKGRRPSFIEAAEPFRAKELYEAVAREIEARGITVATGVFGADMQVHIHNSGPVTIVLDTDLF